MDNKIIEKELSYKLGGIFFETQNKLGRFCREKQYADAFENKLKENKINFEREASIEIENRKSNFVDFIIENRLLVDFKAKPFIEKEDYNQMKRYLEASKLELGLIVNFRSRYLKPKRVLNSKYLGHSDKFVALNRANAFTTIELLVAMTIFVIIVSLATGSFIVAMRSQRAMVNLMAVTDNASLAIEQMAREIRTGYEFCVGANANCAEQQLVFTNYLGEQVIYRLDSNRLERNSQPLTATNVSIETLKFIVSGNQTGDDQATRVTIVLKVAVPQTGPIGVRGVFTNLQTTVSARNLD